MDIKEYVHNELLSQADADKLLSLVKGLNITERMAGRRVAQFGKDYEFSGRIFKGQEIPDWLEKVTQWASKLANTEFNSVLINHYPAGIPVGIGMHRDDEPELGENPAVLSISLGASCVFKVRSRDAGWKVHLHHGDVLLMKPGFQSVFTHGIDKTVFPEDRYSLTFRKFI